MRTYVRWQLGAERLGRVMQPMSEDHPAAAAPCWVCGERLANGEPVQLLALGPEPDDVPDCRAGKWFSASAWVFHAPCLGTFEALAPQPVEST